MTTILTTTGLSLYNYSKRKNGGQEPTEDQLREFLREEPQKASAEANSLLLMAKPEDTLVFLYTETREVTICVNVLKSFFINRGYKHVRLEPLQFRNNEKHIETQGIRNLIETLINEIEEAQKQNQSVVINATAGLKAQIVYSTMIGMLYNVPVKYLHESYTEIVTFAPVALSWNTSIFFEHSWFFDWLRADLRKMPEVEEQLQYVAEKNTILSMLAPDKDGDIFLSPMGLALEKRFKNEAEKAQIVDWPPDALETDPEKKLANSIMRKYHHPPKLTKEICLKIARLPYVVEIRGGNYENTTRTSVKDFNDKGEIFLLWADNEKATNLTVQTTAEGRPQTQKVAEQIKEIVRKESPRYIGQ